MKFNEIINGIVDEYLSAWNGKDLKKILTIFSENGALESPFFQLIDPEHLKPKIIGKENLAYSYNIFFNSSSYFKLNKLSVEKHDKVITTYVNDLNNNIVLKSIFTLNEYGKLQCLTITKN